MAGRQAVNVGLIGVGTVGSGVARILAEKRDVYARQLGSPLVLKGALVRDLGKVRPGLPGEFRELLTTNPSDILDDPEIEIVVEVWVGEHPALEFISKALDAGKYVVTANKEVMAKHGAHLLALAREHGVDILFEASVGGGIPIIAPLKRDLLANRVLALAAIINGTTNYILTAMSRDGADFARGARSRAAARVRRGRPGERRRGRGRALQAGDPGQPRVPYTGPPGGHLPRRASPSSPPATSATPQELGYAIKLLALARAEAGGIQARVHPALVPAGRAPGEGRWRAQRRAGRRRPHRPRATSRAVAPAACRRPARSSPTCWTRPRASSAGGARCMPAKKRPALILPMSELRTRYYIRLTVADQPGRAGPDRPHASARREISISSVIQKEADEDAQTAELVIMTHRGAEASMQEALVRLQDARCRAGDRQLHPGGRAVTTQREVPFTGDTLGWVHSEIAEIKSKLALAQQAHRPGPRGRVRRLGQSEPSCAPAWTRSRPRRRRCCTCRTSCKLVREQLTRVHDDIHSLRTSREEVERRLFAEAERERQEKNDSTKRFGEMQRQIDAWQERFGSVEERNRHQSGDRVADSGQGGSAADRNASLRHQAIARSDHAEPPGPGPLPG